MCWFHRILFHRDLWPQKVSEWHLIAVQLSKSKCSKCHMLSLFVSSLLRSSVPCASLKWVWWKAVMYFTRYRSSNVLGRTHARTDERTDMVKTSVASGQRHTTFGRMHKNWYSTNGNCPWTLVVHSCAWSALTGHVNKNAVINREGKVSLFIKPITHRMEQSDICCRSGLSLNTFKTSFRTVSWNTAPRCALAVLLRFFGANYKFLD